VIVVPIAAVPRYVRLPSLARQHIPVLALKRLAEAPDTKEDEAQHSEVGQLTEDDEEESQRLVGGAGEGIDSAVENHCLRNAKGVAGPDDREHKEDEGGEGFGYAVLSYES
jgi:hypothetical protein